MTKFALTGLGSKGPLALAAVVALAGGSSIARPRRVRSDRHRGRHGVRRHRAAPHEATVIVVDGRIADVGPKVAIPRGATIIQAKGEALLPGFFDVHTHWTPGGMPKTTPQIANAYIASGVTTTTTSTPRRSPGRRAGRGSPPWPRRTST